MKMLGALILGVFWQQGGWLAHDFAHHQVFRNRSLNDLTTLICCSYLGFSMDWWKTKHNTHHAIPNLHESLPAAHDGDPDIDTLPFLAWSRKLARKVIRGGEFADNAFARLSVSHQNFLYFPLLCLARMAWAMQSVTWVFDVNNTVWITNTGANGEQTKQSVSTAAGVKYKFGEKLALIVHYAYILAILVFTMPNVPVAVAYFLVAQMWGGLLLALVFGVGHNGMAVYDADAKPGFGELQVTTTRNVEGTAFNSWFMGGLEYQIEHHLYPAMPRHSFARAAARTQALCKKHGVPYRCTGLLEGTNEVLTYLKDVAVEIQNGPM
jgi:fatty acid desaturase